MGELVPERLSTEYANLSARFSKLGNDYTKQYCSIYKGRLSKMKELLKHRITKKWGVEYPICDLHKLAESDYKKCVVIATIFKDQKLKPSVLKQLAETNSLVPQPVHTHFTDESDTLFVEDELQRYCVVGDLDATELVTGITCAFLGTDIGNGKFEVEDYCFADLQGQIKRPILNDDMYVVFISGLDLVHVEKTLLPLRLFVSWISGFLGDLNGVEITKVVRLIVAGNSARVAREKIKSTVSLTSRQSELPEVLESVKVLDAFLTEVSRVIDVDVMPGEHDPSNYVLPQQSMHYCLFPKSMPYKSLNRVTNPYECRVGGVRMLGSSGQPVSNIMGFCDIGEPIEVLERCLRWSHMAPTAPDTLGCLPVYENDPFVIEDCPHVMFAGNQETFGTKMCEGEAGQKVRLVCVPEFANSFTVAVLNLKTLDCFPIHFK